MKIVLLAGNPATDFGLELDEDATGIAIVRLRAPWTALALARIVHDNHRRSPDSH